MNKLLLKYTIRWTCLTVGLCLMTSCLKHDLEDLPAFEEHEISQIFFEYRYTDPNDIDLLTGIAIMKTVSLTTDATIDKEAGTVSVKLTVPGVNSDGFTSEERAKVALTNLTVRITLSTAAHAIPVEGAPELGIPGDFSKPVKYKVVAADGSSQVWTITVSELSK